MALANGCVWVAMMMGARTSSIKRGACTSIITPIITIIIAKNRWGAKIISLNGAKWARIKWLINIVIISAPAVGDTSQRHATSHNPPGPHYKLILKSFMCVDPATLKVHLLFNYRHCCRCFNGTDTDDFFYPLYYHIHCLYLGKPPMGHTIISITRAVAGGIIVPKALLWTEMTNGWMTIWCASSSIEIRYPVLWNGY